LRVSASARLPGLWGDLLLLAKPGISAMVLAATAFGYLLAGQGKSDWPHLALVLGLTFLVGAGSNSLNQYLERDVDARMVRTRNRPLPAGRLPPAAVLIGGGLACAAGAGGLWLAANPLSGMVALTVIITYVFIYTPLKQVTHLNTLVGAFPGALPPVLGWVAAGGALGREALALFLIEYLWQPPHVLAIAWRYRHDYAAAGMPMLPVIDPSGAGTRRQVILYAATFIPVTLYPGLLGMAGNVYLAGAALVSGVYFAGALAMGLNPTDASARLLFRLSLAVLPALFVLMLLDALPTSLFG